MKLSKETLTKIIKEELQQEIERSNPNQKFDFEDSIEELVNGRFQFRLV